MNYLSHYYFDKDDDRPHYILGLILPDIIRTFNRERLHHQTIETHWDAPIQHLQEGINKHHHIDKLFHNSHFFKTHDKKAFKQLQQIEFEGIKKYKHFVSHVLVEMLLDKLLLKEDTQIAPTFYSKLNAADKYIFLDYFNHIPLVKGNLDNLWFFFQRFCSSQFLYDYQHSEGLIERLDGVMRRITKQSFTAEDKLRLGVFVNEMEEELTGVYREIFEELGC